LAAMMRGPSRIAIRLAGNVSAKQTADGADLRVKPSPDFTVFARRDDTLFRFQRDFASLTHGAGHPSRHHAARLCRPRRLAQRPTTHHRDVLAYEVSARSPTPSTEYSKGTTTRHHRHRGVGRAPAAGGCGWTPEQMVQAIGITVGATHRNERAATMRGRTRKPSRRDCRRKAMFSRVAHDGIDRSGKCVRGNYGFFKVMAKAGRSAAAWRALSASPRSHTLSDRASSRRPSRRPVRWKGAAVHQSADDIPTVTFHVSHSRSRSWPDSPKNGSARRMKPPTTVSRMRRGLVLMYGKDRGRNITKTLSARRQHA